MAEMSREEVLARYRHLRAIGTRHHTEALRFLSRPALLEQARQLGLAAGGILAAVLRSRAGPPGWNVMPPGSTPRLVLCVTSGLLGLWVAATVVQGPGIAFRFAVMTVIALSVARSLATDEVAAATTAAGALLLAVAVASAVQGTSTEPLPFVAAAAVAAGAAWWPRRAARAS